MSPNRVQVHNKVSSKILWIDLSLICFLRVFPFDFIGLSFDLTPGGNLSEDNVICDFFLRQSPGGENLHLNIFNSKQSLHVTEGEVVAPRSGRHLYFRFPKMVHP